MDRGARIALVVDNPLRDLAGLTLVAVELCRRGMTCYLVPLNRQPSELRALAPDTVVLNYLRPGNDDLADSLAAADVATVVLDTEGGIFPNLDWYGQTLPADAATRHRISAFCTWGPRMAEYAVTKGWFTPAQVVVTGTPRFDFYAPQWQPATVVDPAPFLDPHQPMVLINGNFPVANPRFQSPEQEATMLVERFGHSPEAVAVWQEQQRTTLRGMVRVVNELGARFPGVNVAYRPHPFERLETYAPLLESRPNVALVRTGPVAGWIVHASAVIQRSCTTAVEAALAGVPALSPRWLPASTEMPAAEAVSIGCSSEAELIEMVDRAVAGALPADPDAAKALDDVVADWFLRIDGEAHRRVSDTIESVTTGHDLAEHRQRCRSVGISGRPFKAFARRYVPPGIWHRLGRRSAAGRDDKRFAVDDVRHVVDGINKVSPVAVDIECASRDDYALRHVYRRSIAIRPRAS